jgi:hypothetical protein
MKDSKTLLAVGDRVQLHPGTDVWMQGDRFGEIVKIVPNLLGYGDGATSPEEAIFVIALDKSKRKLRFTRDLIGSKL